MGLRSVTGLLLMTIFCQTLICCKLPVTMLLSFKIWTNLSIMKSQRTHRERFYIKSELFWVGKGSSSVMYQVQMWYFENEVVLSSMDMTYQSLFPLWTWHNNCSFLIGDDIAVVLSSLDMTQPLFFPLWTWHTSKWHAIANPCTLVLNCSRANISVKTCQFLAKECAQYWWTA